MRVSGSNSGDQINPQIHHPKRRFRSPLSNQLSKASEPGYHNQTTQAILSAQQQLQQNREEGKPHSDATIRAATHPPPAPQ